MVAPAHPIGALDALEQRPAITLRGVSKTYQTQSGATHALTSTDLVIARGEVVCLLGPSGCGKTTLLRMIGGLVHPTTGTIDVDGATAQAGDALGMVFQEANLFPWLDVLGNVALPLQLQGIGRHERLAKARDYIALVGLSGFETRWPRELSGGMRQRASIARALSYDPSILLMDEPFGALDAMTRDAMNLELQAIWLKTRKTIVIVTHSINEAVFLADTLILLSARPGRIDTVVKVPFPRPRTIELQSTTAYQEIVLRLRQRLSASH